MLCGPRGRLLQVDIRLAETTIQLSTYRQLGMPKSRTDVLQGTLELLVLRSLASAGPLHGYAITAHIHRVSADLLRVEEGSLYPALHRMAQDGLLKASWGVTDRNREARFYEITAKGRKQLEAERESWARLIDGVGRVLRYA